MGYEMPNRQILSPCELTHSLVHIRQYTPTSFKITKRKLYKQHFWGAQALKILHQQDNAVVFPHNIVLLNSMYLLHKHLFLFNAFVTLLDFCNLNNNFRLHKVCSIKIIIKCILVKSSRSTFDHRYIIPYIYKSMVLTSICRS